MPAERQHLGTLSRTKTEPSSISSNMSDHMPQPERIAMSRRAIRKAIAAAPTYLVTTLVERSMGRVYDLPKIFAATVQAAKTV